MDQITDRNHSLLYNLYRRGVVPDYVLQDTALTEKEAASFADTAFADTHTRSFPIVTKGDTWLSLAHFTKNRDSIPGHKRGKIKGLLDKAAEFWNIPPEDLTDLDAPVEKTASEEEEPGVRIIYKTAEEQIAAPLAASGEDVKLLAEDLLEKRGSYPLDTRRSVARQLLDAADKLKAEVTPGLHRSLQKTAGYGAGSVSDTVYAVQKRQYLCARRFPEMKEQLQKVADYLLHNETGLIGPVVLEKVAGLLDFVDRSNELQHRWTQTEYPCPEEALYRWTEDDMEAVGKEAACLTDGTLMPVQKLANSFDSLHDLFDQEFNVELNRDTLKQQIEEIPPVLCRRIHRVLEG